MAAAGNEHVSRGVDDIPHIAHWQWKDEADPDRSIYMSFAQFCDPDRNLWMLQEMHSAT
jgi:hypothetical protein